MIRFENSDFAIAIACNADNAPVCMVLSTDSIGHGTGHLMATKKGELAGTDLCLTGDAEIVLKGMQQNIRECISANIPLVLIDSATNREVAISVTIKPSEA